MVVSRFEVHRVRLGPTVGRELRKTRPAVVISPDELNHHLGTVIIAPLTSAQRPYPTRVSCRFDNRPGQVVLDQIRTVDKARLVKRLGRLSAPAQRQTLKTLAELFAP